MRVVTLVGQCFGRQVAPALMILESLQTADTPGSKENDLVYLLLNRYVNQMSRM